MFAGPLTLIAVGVIWFCVLVFWGAVVGLICVTLCIIAFVSMVWRELRNMTTVDDDVCP